MAAQAVVHPVDTNLRHRVICAVADLPKTAIESPQEPYASSNLLLRRTSSNSGSDIGRKGMRARRHYAAVSVFLQPITKKFQFALQRLVGAVGPVPLPRNLDEALQRDAALLEIRTSIRELPRRMEKLMERLVGEKTRQDHRRIPFASRVPY